MTEGHHYGEAAFKRYGKPSFKQLNSITYLRTRKYVWTDGRGRGIEECLVQEGNESIAINIGHYDHKREITRRINSEEIMVIYTLYNDLLEIDAVIDLNELKVLALTKDEQLKCFKACCEAQIPPKEDLDIVVLNKNSNSPKQRVFYKNY